MNQTLTRASVAVALATGGLFICLFLQPQTVGADCIECE